MGRQVVLFFSALVITFSFNHQLYVLLGYRVYVSPV